MDNSDSSPVPPPIDPAQGRVTFNFEKSQDYRVVAASGAWGGITPQGDFFLDFFADHWATPNQVVHEIEPNGSLGKEVRRDPPHALSATRTRQVGVVLTLEQAHILSEFVRGKIEAFKAAREVASQVEEQRL